MHAAALEMTIQNPYENSKQIGFTATENVIQMKKQIHEQQTHFKLRNNAKS